MPTISRFYGIVVFMNYREHAPPHFHARYQEFEVTIDIQTRIVRGTMPARALAMLFAWTEIHRDELLANWQRAEAGQQLVTVAPLI
jgi:hypothetical protein